MRPSSSGTELCACDLAGLRDLFQHPNDEIARHPSNCFFRSGEGSTISSDTTALETI